MSTCQPVYLPIHLCGRRWACVGASRGLAELRIRRWFFFFLFAIKENLESETGDPSIQLPPKATGTNTLLQFGEARNTCCSPLLHELLIHRTASSTPCCRDLDLPSLLAAQGLGTPTPSWALHCACVWLDVCWDRPWLGNSFDMVAWLANARGMIHSYSQR
jgi:hypothetical protein